MSGIRLFVAIPLPPEIRRALLKHILPYAGNAFRLTEEQNLHVTVHFIGEVQADEVGEIQKRLDGVASRHRSFELKVQTAGPGPNRRRPRLLWAECSPSELFSGLALEVAGELAGFGNAEEVRHPRPHVTLARLRRGAEPPAGLESSPFPEDGMIPVREICLWKSRIMPGGAQYAQVASFPLR